MSSTVKAATVPADTYDMVQEREDLINYDDKDKAKKSPDKTESEDNGDTKEARDDEDTKANEDEDQTCCICLLKMDKQDIGAPKGCVHKFCLECILLWCSTRATCPVDRHPVTTLRAYHGLAVEEPYWTIHVGSGDIPSDVQILYCEVCGGTDQPHFMLMCENCGQQFHLHCLNPPLRSRPRTSSWMCPDCTMHPEAQSGPPLREGRTQDRYVQVSDESSSDEWEDESSSEEWEDESSSDEWEDESSSEESQNESSREGRQDESLREERQVESASEERQDESASEERQVESASEERQVESASEERQVESASEERQVESASEERQVESASEEYNIEELDIPAVPDAGVVETGFPSSEAATSPVAHHVHQPPTNSDNIARSQTPLYTNSSISVMGYDGLQYQNVLPPQPQQGVSSWAAWQEPSPASCPMPLSSFAIVPWDDPAPSAALVPCPLPFFTLPSTAPDVVTAAMFHPNPTPGHHLQQDENFVQIQYPEFPIYPAPVHHIQQHANFVQIQYPAIQICPEGALVYHCPAPAPDHAAWPAQAMTYIYDEVGCYISSQYTHPHLNELQQSYYSE